MSETPRVLVVDDSETAREIYAAFLRDAGYDVLEAEDGPSGLERVESENPDVVILDMLLPRMDGLEVMRRIRETALHSDVPIICVTASLSDQYRSRAQKLRCNAFLEKPDSARRIVDVVRKVLADRAVAGGDEPG